MAGKGGGAWKVAYADFVTAMMAFFLVMWIVGQDQKVRRSVSDYFSDPLGNIGETGGKTPSRTGAILEGLNSGSVPNETAVDGGKGREVHTYDRNPSPPTAMVANWLRSNEKTHAYWKKQTADHRDAVRDSKELKQKKDTERNLVIARLSKQLETEMQREVNTVARSIHRDLLHKMLEQINWRQLAEDLVLD